MILILIVERVRKNKIERIEISQEKKMIGNHETTKEIESQLNLNRIHLLKKDTKNTLM